MTFCWCLYVAINRKQNFRKIRDMVLPKCKIMQKKKIDWTRHELLHGKRQKMYLLNTMNILKRYSREIESSNDRKAFIKWTWYKKKLRYHLRRSRHGRFLRKQFSWSNREDANGRFRLKSISQNGWFTTKHNRIYIS